MDNQSKLIKYCKNVYNGLSTHLSEFAYQRALEIELQCNNHNAIREYNIPQKYKGVIISNLRVDLFVQDMDYLIEVKKICHLGKKEKEQAKLYCELTNYPVMLINFGYKDIQYYFYTPSSD